MALLMITDQNYEVDVLAYSGAVLLDFGAAWCGPCKKLEPILTELAEEYHGRVLVGKVDISESPEVATHFGVMSVPYLLFLREGHIKNRYAALAPKAKIAAMLEDLLA